MRAVGATIPIFGGIFRHAKDVMNKFVTFNFLLSNILLSILYLLMIFCKNTSLIQSQNNYWGILLFCVWTKFMSGFDILSISWPSPESSSMLMKLLDILFLTSFSSTVASWWKTVFYIEIYIAKCFLQIYFQLHVFVVNWYTCIHLQGRQLLWKSHFWKYKTFDDSK